MDRNVHISYRNLREVATQRQTKRPNVVGEAPTQYIRDRLNLFRPHVMGIT